MDTELSSLTYSTLLFGIMRLLIAIYAFFLVGIKQKKTDAFLYQKFIRYFIFFLGMWQLTRAVYYLYPETELLPRIMLLGLISVPLTTLTYFCFCFSYAFPKKTKLLLYFWWLALIPAITIFIILVPEYNHYFIEYTGEIIYVPYRELVPVYKPYFYVHTIFSYSLAFVGLLCLLTKLRAPATRRKFCGYTIIATVLFILSNMNRIFFSSNEALWFVPLLDITILTMFFWVVYADETQLIINKGQEKLMQSLMFPIFFLNKDKKIIYANQLATKICPNIYKNGKITGSKAHILENFSPYQMGSQMLQDKLTAHKTDFLFQSNKDGTLYYAHQQSIAPKEQKQKYQQGEMFLLITVSAMKNFFSALEDKAFRDPLCGCFNRHYLEVKHAKFFQNTEAPANILPLSFIMCDIDGLKKVNDGFGHEVGDEYLILCHDTMKSTIRQDDWIFRLGGDEFLIMLPNTPKTVAQTIVATIEEKMQQVQRKYPTSISIGVSTAETYPVDYVQCIHQADDAMYKKKQARKAGLLNKSPRSPSTEKSHRL